VRQALKAIQRTEAYRASETGLEGFIEGCGETQFSVACGGRAPHLAIRAIRVIRVTRVIRLIRVIRVIRVIKVIRAIELLGLLKGLLGLLEGY
jgi:hypothetical protein